MGLVLALWAAVDATNDLRLIKKHPTFQEWGPRHWLGLGAITLHGGQALVQAVSLSLGLLSMFLLRLPPWFLHHAIAVWLIAASTIGTVNTLLFILIRKKALNEIEENLEENV